MSFIASTTSRADSSDCELSAMACRRMNSKSSPVAPVRADSPDRLRSNSIDVRTASVSAAVTPATPAPSPVRASVVLPISAAIFLASPPFFRRAPILAHSLPPWMPMRSISRV